MISSQGVLLLMRSLLLWVFLLGGVSSLYGAEGEKLEVRAKVLETTQHSVRATDGVVVYYQDAMIKAKTAFYNRDTHRLTLDGEVEMIGYQGSKEHTTHLEIDTQTKEVTFHELFFVSSNDVWLFTDKANRKEHNYSFGTTLLSSCDVDDPLWKMVFARSLYDSQAHYMKVYHAKIYFGDLPILYTPYMAFTTQKERSSGLLYPLFGYTTKEGYLYEQPIFWAISESMDLELNPQLRTDRSQGLYGTFRFVTSPYASGKLRLGYFKDSKAYQLAEETTEAEHYGVEFNYESSRVWSDRLGEGVDDGLYINSTFLNDIDYINLQQGQLKHFGLTPLQESRFNYFLSTDAYYLGVNAKYFVDTRKVDNNTTLQILPSLQLHKHLDRLIWDNLTYSVDLQFKNFTREEGTTLKQVEVKLPLEFTMSFWDDFLNLSLGESLYYSKFFFGNDTYEYDLFEYYSNIHKAKLFSDLTKHYGSVIHVLQPAVEYIKPGNETQDPVAFEALSPEQKELFAVGLPEEYYTFSLSQYFYDARAKLRFYQRLSQAYYPNRDYTLSDIHNEMQYNWRKWQFYSDLVYSHEFGEVRKLSSRIALRESGYGFSLAHSYKQMLPDQPTTRTSNDLNFNFNYTLNERVSLHGALTYNIDDAASGQWKVGGEYKRDCWSMSASVRQDIIPRPTGYTKENTFYVRFNFIPFGGVGSEE